MKILLYAYGNPGRQDDGLGDALAQMIEKENLPGITIDSNYQLNIEDAALVAEYDTAIFADASVNCTEPFEFSSIAPSKEIAFTTHAMSPQSVLALCEDVYKKSPPAYLLAIRGYEWEMEEPMTEKAKKNLGAAFQFVLDFIRKSGTAKQF